MKEQLGLTKRLSVYLISAFLRDGDAITWDSRLGCPRAGILPALQKWNVIKSSFLSGGCYSAVLSSMRYKSMRYKLDQLRIPLGSGCLSFNLYPP